MSKTTQKRVQFLHTPARRVVGVFMYAWTGMMACIVLAIATALVVTSSPNVEAAPQQTINFQGRLRQTGGTVVPDGHYNITFRLYAASSSGTHVWEEAHVDSNGPTAGNDFRVRVLNGYFTVSLGASTPFPGTIDWGEELWLTMNVGGAAQQIPDDIDWAGETSPRTKVPAHAYAFKAEEAKSLATAQGANTGTLGWQSLTDNRSVTLPDADGVVCVQASASCGFAPATGGANYIQNGTVQQTGANFNVADTGKAGVFNATTSLQLNGADINTAGTLSNVAYLNAVTTFQATDDSTEAFRVQTSGSATVLGVDTVNDAVSIGTQQTTETFDLLAGQPASMPGTTARAVAWSPDDQYLAVGTGTATRLHVYKRSGNTFTKLTTTTPAGDVYDVTWSPDGQYLTAAHANSPYVTTYKRSGDTFTKLSDLAGGNLVSGTARGASWSPDGRYLSVAHFNASGERASIYRRDGDVLTKLVSPITSGEQPAGNAYSTRWSPDGQYVAVGHTADPYLSVYKRSGERFTRLSLSGFIRPASGGGYLPSVSWSPDGAHLAVGSYASGANPGVIIYELSSDILTKLANPTGIDVDVTGVFGVAYSPDGTRLLATGDGVTGRLVVLSRSGSTYGLSRYVAGVDTGRGVDWSSDGMYVARTNLSASPVLSVFKVGNGTHADLSVYGSAYYAGQVVANSVVASGTVVAGTATFGSLAATSADVQSLAISDTLTAASTVTLRSDTTTPGLLTLGVRSDTGDPSGAPDGSMYYSAAFDQFRCKANGIWLDCASGDAGAAGAFVQGGNNMGSDMSLGTTDAYGLSVIVNNNEVANISAAGDIVFTPDETFAVNNASDATVLGVNVADHTVDLNADVDINGLLAVNGGGLTVAGQATVGGELTVAGKTTVTDDLTVQNGLSVDVGLGMVSVPGDMVVGGTTTADRLLLGSPATATLTGAKLVTTIAEIQTVLRLGTATSGVSWNDITTGSGGGKLRLYGDSRNNRTLTLTPEYAGAVLSGSGLGTMTTAYDSTARKTYYQWTSTNGSDQTYNIVARVGLPSDWSEWSAQSICLDSRSSNTTNSFTTLGVKDTTGTGDISGQNIVPGSTNTWVNNCYALDSGDYDADGVITITLTVHARSSSTLRLGNLTLNYLSSF